MARDPAQLEQQLLKDVSEAKELSAKSDQARGAPTRGEQRESFGVRSVRVAQKVVGEEQIKAIDERATKAIDKLLEQSGIVEETKQQEFRTRMQRKFNEFKLEAIKRSQEMEKRAAKLGLDQKQMEGIGGAVGNLFGGGISQAIGNLGGGSVGISRDETIASLDEQAGQATTGFTPA